MTTYEAVFILDPKLVEDGGEVFSQEIAKHIKSLGGRVQQRNGLGRKQFARPIGKHRAGCYWDFILDLDPAKTGLLLDKYRLNSTVLRMMVFLYEVPPPVEKPAERSVAAPAAP